MRGGSVVGLEHTISPHNPKEIVIFFFRSLDYIQGQRPHSNLEPSVGTRKDNGTKHSVILGSWGLGQITEQFSNTELARLAFSSQVSTLKVNNLSP